MATHQRWEYLHVELGGSNDGNARQLNTYGDLGWEVVNFTAPSERSGYYLYLLKRPKA